MKVNLIPVEINSYVQLAAGGLYTAAGDVATVLL